LGKRDGTIADIRIGNSKLDERKASRGLIRQHHKKISMVDGDGLHENKDMFNLCEKYKIETAKNKKKCTNKSPWLFRKKEGGCGI